MQRLGETERGVMKHTSTMEVAALAVLLFTSARPTYCDEVRAGLGGGRKRSSAATTVSTATNATAAEGNLCGSGDGHPLLCRGGTRQGQPCSADGDCGAGAICRRHGHSDDCLEMCGPSCPGSVLTSGQNLGGSAGDTIGDQVVGECSTEENVGPYALTPEGLFQPMSLAYDATSGVLWVTPDFASAIRGFASPTVTNSPASLSIGQPDLIAGRWNRLPGDHNNDGAVHTAYSLPQAHLYLGMGTTGDLWLGEVWFLKKFQPPLATNMSAALTLCSTSLTSVERPNPEMACYGYGAAVNSNGVVAAPSGAAVYIFDPAPATNGQSAAVCLGQANCSVGKPQCNRGGAVAANTLCGAKSAAFLSDGRLVVADGGNNRLLVFDPPFTNGMNASLVLGQSSMTANIIPTSPSAASFKLALVPSDAEAGYAAVAATDDAIVLSDPFFNRVLIWPYPGLNGEAATHVIGQPSFTTSGSSLSATGLRQPHGVAVGGGNLYVADSQQNRVLRFAWPVIRNGPAALSVLGQPDFVTSHLKATPRTFGADNVSGLAFNQTTGGVYIGDNDNNRIMYWSSRIDAHSGGAATKVIGQPGFGIDDYRCNRGGTAGPDTICDPRELGIDSANNVYVVDRGNNRILKFIDPATSDTTADDVIGQPNLTSNGDNQGGLSASSLAAPTGLYIDAFDNVWVADSGNRRVLLYCRTPATVGGLCRAGNSGDWRADLVLGQKDFALNTNAGCAHPSAATICYPKDVLYDATTRTIFVTDSSTIYGQARILGYRFRTIPANGMAATFAIGVSSLTSWSTCSHTRTSGCDVASLAMSAGRNLYITEMPGVIEYSPPFSTGMPAARAFGINKSDDWSNRGVGTGYVSCQWNVSGQLEFDGLTNDMWVVDGARETSRVMITLNPEGPPPTATSAPKPTATKVATPARGPQTPVSSRPERR